MRNIDDVDVVIVLRRCDAEAARKLYSAVASMFGKGAYRFALVIEGRGFDECLDTVRDVLQSFIAASFMVVDGSYKLSARRGTVVVE